MQEQLRSLRDQWKQVDRGGPPNHGLWKRFDEACNEAYKVVQEWLDKVKTEAAENRAARLALIREVKDWAAANQTALDGDWKGFNRILHQFSDRWREAGHLSEKAFAELQPQWKEAMALASGPLDRMQKESVDRRHAMIEEAKVLGDAPMLRIDAVKALQQRWQAEAQTVPLERKFEQKLWDAFRKPIDDAFNRKTAEREKSAAAMSGRDRAVLEASKAVEEATAGGDAQKIRAALAALEQAMRARDDEEAAKAAAPAAAPAPEAASGDEAVAAEAGAEGGAAEGEAPAAPAPAPKAPPKPVVAMRSGDDRPGARRAEPAPMGRGGKFDSRRPAPGGRGGPGGPGGFGGGGFGGGRGDFGGRGGDRFEREDRGPRLGDAAFRAQRDALEHAQATLRKLAAQAHGEALTQLLTAWEQRAADRCRRCRTGSRGVARGAPGLDAGALRCAQGRCGRNAAAAGDRRRRPDAGGADLGAAHAAADLADQAPRPVAAGDPGRGRGEGAGDGVRRGCGAAAAERVEGVAEGLRPHGAHASVHTLRRVKYVGCAGAACAPLQPPPKNPSNSVTSSGNSSPNLPRFTK
ncbi:DUF349 domain-containing protein [Ramlibacter terrae]|uniref:DUF349 domain-containing protein n=1 Tax=Ramlibacter terrae TaxID=2732511 RepID=A0ABX6P257_9BURK|nr:DUF349 domain-containing protein [Ramlibacter terrae]